MTKITYLSSTLLLVKNGKSEHHSRVLHNLISLDTKFQLKLTVLVIWPNLPKKDISGQNGKMNTILEFSIFELIWVPNYSLN